MEKKQLTPRPVFLSKRLLCTALFILTLTIVTFIIFTQMTSKHPPKDNSIVAAVNGEPITVREFKRFLNDSNANIHNYFKQKYNIDDSPGFWTANYSGEIPIAVAREKALTAIVRKKVELMTAKDKHLVQDISYSKFLSDLQNENIKRQEAQKKQQVFFGPTQYGERDYYDYLFSNMAVKLKETLSQKEIPVSDTILLQYYNTSKESRYKLEDTITIEKITVTPTTAQANTASLLQKLKAALDEGADLKNTAASYQTQTLDLKIDYATQTFDPATNRNDAEHWSFLKTEAQNLATGQISQVIENNRAAYIIKCLERKPGGYQPFDEIKENVKLHYVDQEYEKYMEDQVKKAAVHIHNDIYNKVFISE